MAASTVATASGRVGIVAGENASVREGETIDVAGTHSYPSGTVIRLLFLTGGRKYLLPGDTVVLGTGRHWSSRLRVPEKATGLTAVLATQKALGYFSVTADQPTDKADLKDLPRGARVVATRSFAKKATK